MKKKEINPMEDYARGVVMMSSSEDEDDDDESSKCCRSSCQIMIGLLHLYLICRVNFLSKQKN